LELFGIIFPKWVQHSLQTISARRNSIGPNASTVAMHSPRTAFRIYSKLDHLVTSFNAIFGNLLIGIKFSSLVSICLLLYVPIRHPVDMPMALGHFTLMLAVLVKVGPLITSMGDVQTESINFKKSWIHALGNNHTRNGDEIGMEDVSQEMAPFSYVPPIFFNGGPFYDIHSYTILTFFSIVTTYIIVVLHF